MLRCNLIGTIGNTPTVEIKYMIPKKNVKIYAKLEWFNPTGSIKDRIAQYMVLKAEESGELTPDKTILEATSGNTGISLGLIGRLRGYKVKVVMPENVSLERRELLSAFGVEVVLSDGDKGTNGAIKVAKEIGAEGNYFMPDQYSNSNNVLAHYETTGAEILEEVSRIDYFVAGLGTGGTLMGVGKKLKEHNPDVKLVAVQPYPKSGLQGLRNLSEGFIPPILNLDLLDFSEFVEDEDAFKALKDLAEKEGLFAGISSGAVLFKAIEIGRRIEKGNIVVVFPDGGWKYLSEKIWTEDPALLSKRFEGPLW
jgi:cysteine synthase B